MGVEYRVLKFNDRKYFDIFYLSVWKIFLFKKNFFWFEFRVLCYMWLWWLRWGEFVEEVFESLNVCISIVVWLNKNLLIDGFG